VRQGHKVNLSKTKTDHVVTVIYREIQWRFTS